MSDTVVIFVDADACPVKSIIAEEAARYQVRAIFVCSFANHFEVDGYFSELVTVDKSYQSADMYIVNNARHGDIIVTDDYGLAGLVLAKRCLAISSRGKEYTNDNIDRLLMSRHLSYKERLSGKGSKGPRRLSTEDTDRFHRILQKCLEFNAGNYSSFVE